MRVIKLSGIHELPGPCAWYQGNGEEAVRLFEKRFNRPVDVLYTTDGTLNFYIACTLDEYRQGIGDMRKVKQSEIK